MRQQLGLILQWWSGNVAGAANLLGERRFRGIDREHHTIARLKRAHFVVAIGLPMR